MNGPDQPLTTYRQRSHALAPDVEFTLDEGVLSWADNKGHTGALNLAQISGLRITYDPSRLMAPRWIVDITADGVKEVRFTSTTLVGAGGLRSRNSAFLGFLAALHDGLGERAPGAICRFGPSRPVYALYVTLWWLPILGMIWGTYRAFTTSIASAGLFFAFLSLYSGRFALGYTYYNRPRRYDPRHPPLHLLPKPSTRDV